MPTFDVGSGEAVTAVAAQAIAAQQQAVAVAGQQEQQPGAGPLGHSAASSSAAPGQGPSTIPPFRGPSESAAPSQGPSDSAQSQGPSAAPSHDPTVASSAPSPAPTAMHSQGPSAAPRLGLESQTAAPTQSPLSEVEANNSGSLGAKRRRDDATEPACQPKSKRAFYSAAAFAIAGGAFYSYAPQAMVLPFGYSYAPLLAFGKAMIQAAAQRAPGLVNGSLALVTATACAE